jgi:hypothetical protein
MHNTNDPGAPEAVVGHGNAWRLPLLKGAGLSFILVAIALNAYLLVDAIAFEMGENQTPTCGIFRETTGFDFVILAFAAQVITSSVLAFALRSWLFCILSVFPFWVIFWSAICVVP